MSRLSSGGLIDRRRPLAFSFDGRRYVGLKGDTLASALVANGVRLVGRSFKYHRPRGLLTAGSEEPNGLVTLGRGARAEPNTRATVVPLSDGLEAVSQNRWPSLGFDIMAANQLAAPLIGAGFYYKTFMWPSALWEKLYEPLIRRAAGLGRLSTAPDPDSYDRSYAFCDLLVIGGGPAGLAAALTAGRAGLRVIVAEQDFRLGGRLLAELREVDGMPGIVWVGTALAELAAFPNVRLLPRTTVFGVYDGREYGAVEHLAGGGPRQRLWRIVARHSVLATGAIERPLVFAGNDRPGVMMASAVSSYVNRFAAAPGRRAVVFTTSDSGWETAQDMIAAGIEVAAVVDARATLPPIAGALGTAGIERLAGAAVESVYGRRVRGVEVRAADGSRRRIDCDLLAVAGGWNPAIGIGSNLGSRPAWSDALSSFVLETAPPGMTPIGAAAGRLSLGAALADGVSAAQRAGEACGVCVDDAVAPRASDEPCAVTPLWHVGGSGAKAFVDFQNDVTAADIALAAREGFASIEHLKRYTTLGMATDQGKTSQLNGHALLAAATGKSIAEAGTVLSRPPYLPVSIGALAGHHRGRHFRPERRTAGHDWAVEQGATFTDAGQWKRAQWFARAGERDWLETVNREVGAVRSGVGVCDVSTLGKIDVLGPDAAALLDRLYINNVAAMPIGKARYGVMLREDGLVMDDGTVTRFAEDRFFVTTTTVNAARVMQHIDYCRQVLWPDLDVQATSVTEQWATYAVAGPRSRALLTELLPDLDLSDAAFPYMAAAEIAWAGAPARVFRLSFSGELAYELSVPACFGDALVRALCRVGERFNLTPYGTDALGVMRIEKGHVGGGELNGQVTAGDLGLARMMSTKKAYVGRVLARRPALTDPGRPALVGIRPAARGAALRAGAHLLGLREAAVTANDQGYVTSAAFSPTLGQWIGLALLQRGAERHGERIRAYDPVRGPDVEVEICAPVFVDPEGARLRG